MDIKKLKDGEIIQEIDGFVGIIGKPYTFGKYNVQALDFELVLSTAETLNVQFRNRDINEIKNMDNLRIKNNPDIKGGTTKISINEYKGKKEIKLIVTKTAIVEKLDKNGNIISTSKKFKSFNNSNKILEEKIQKLEIRMIKIEEAIKSIL